MDVSHVLFIFAVFAVSFCHATIFNKVNDYTAIVSNGEAHVQLEYDMIGIRLLPESVCGCGLFILKFQDRHDSETIFMVFLLDLEVILMTNVYRFGRAHSIDIFITSNGSVYLEKQLLKRALEPLKVDNENRVHFTASKIADGCYVPIVKGKIDESQLENRSAGEFSVWATVVIVVVIVAFIVGGILLIAFHRSLLCFKRKPAPECDKKRASKMDSKLTQSKMQSVSKPKAVKKPSSTPPPPVLLPFSVSPTPSFSGPPTTMETTLAPPRNDPSPSEEPSVAPSSATPPPPANAASSRSTAKGCSKTRR